MNLKLAVLLLSPALGWAFVSQAQPAPGVDLFVAGQGGYATYRIPALVATPQHTLLAACEGRKDNSHDWGIIDLLLRRSVDGGQTWEPMRRLIGQDDLPAGFLHNTAAAATVAEGVPHGFTINNPTWVTCASTGATHFLYCGEYFRCFIVTSHDGGATFSASREITPAFDTFRTRDHYAWKCMAPGPGHGIELASGRLVVPVWLSTSTGGHPHRPSVCATIYSNDHGQTWQAGEIVAGFNDSVPNASESTLAEVRPGQVMINLRSDSPRNRRVIAWSTDGATKWSAPVFVEELWEPVCMAGSVAAPGTGTSTLVYFSNPASLARDAKTAVGSVGRARQNLTLQVTSNGGHTWNRLSTIYAGPSAYSDLALGSDGSIDCFYENGRADPYERMTVVRIPARSGTVLRE